MIDYKNMYLSFRPISEPNCHNAQHVHAYHLCLLYRSIRKYKIEQHPDVDANTIMGELKEIATLLQYNIRVSLAIHRHTSIVDARKSFDEEDSVKRHYRIGTCYFLYSDTNNVGSKIEGIYIDTNEYYRIALEMYMDMEVSLNGFYFYLPQNSRYIKKYKKYNNLWDIPLRNIDDLQPIYNMDTIIKEYVSEEKSKNKLPF